MKRGITLSLVFVFLGYLSSPALTFDEYKKEIDKGIKQEQEEFNLYKKRIDEEFRDYKKLVYEEFMKYKKQISKYWETPLLTSRKVYVEYSKDLKERKIVDFEDGVIKIETVKPIENPKEFFKKSVTSLLTETTEKAFKKNPVLKNVDEKLKRKYKRKILSANLNRKEKVVGDIIVGKTKFSKKEAEKAADRIVAKARLSVKREKGKKKYVLIYKFPKRKIFLKAKKYKPYVYSAANERKLEPSLIFAIMHTESSFNPMATSYIPAYGLMQIVPQTAGKDVTAKLFGKPRILSPSYLYNERNNITIGSGYLYLLYHKYFRGIKNRESRLFCTIAAYNGGPGGVAKAFTGTTSLRRAIKVINSMMPGEVYRTILRNAPMKETRDYLKKVYGRMKLYREF